VRLLGRAAVCAAKANCPDQARQLVEQIKQQSANTEHQRILEIIKEVSELLGDNDILISALEGIVDENPTDFNARFSLAFKHSESDHHEMALMHYLKIPARERSGAAWNNLAVEFDHWKLPLSARDAFEDAEAAGETLASANLADKLINAGFVKEAREKCQAALQAENPHKNVSAALARLEGLPDQESKSLDEILKKSTDTSEFYKEMGKRIANTDFTNMGGKWVGPDCDLAITLDGGRLRAAGSSQKQQSGGSVSSALQQVVFRPRLRSRSPSNTQELSEATQLLEACRGTQTGNLHQQAC
jgi:hypothetical protein